MLFFFLYQFSLIIVLAPFLFQTGNETSVPFWLLMLMTVTLERAEVEMRILQRRLDAVMYLFFVVKELKKKNTKKSQIICQKMFVSRMSPESRL